MAALDRARGGKPARLTQQVQADIIASVRTGAPVSWCAEIVGVSAREMRRWHAEREAALFKPRRQWTELEKRCVEFFAQLAQAQADAGLRIHMAIASSAGLTRERPKRRRTTQRVVATAGAAIVVDAEGKISGGTVMEVTVIEEEMAPSVTAMRLLAAYRFPEEMGALVAPDEWGDTPPERISDESLLKVLQAAGQRAGLTTGDDTDEDGVIDVHGYELEAGVVAPEE